MVYRGGRKTDNLMARLKNDDVEGWALINKRKEIAKTLGISYGAYKCRLLRGWAEEEASICPRVERAVRFYKGQSARSYVLEHGGSLGLYTHYVKYLPLEDAIDRAINKKGLVKYYRDGMTLHQWCKIHNVNYNSEYMKEVRNAEHRKNDQMARENVPTSNL